jgi:hypothetical protein
MHWNLSQKKITNLINLLGIIIILPTIGLVIWILYWLCYDFWALKAGSGYLDLQLLGYLTISILPPLAGILVAKFFIHRQKSILGIIAGIVVVILPYLIWSWNFYLAGLECVKLEPMCNEWSLLTFLAAFILCIINIFAYFGLVMLFEG